MNKLTALLAMMLHPSVTEHEANIAFRALRKRVAADNDLCFVLEAHLGSLIETKALMAPVPTATVQSVTPAVGTPSVPPGVPMSVAWAWITSQPEVPPQTSMVQPAARSSETVDLGPLLTLIMQNMTQALAEFVRATTTRP